MSLPIENNNNNNNWTRRLTASADQNRTRTGIQLQHWRGWLCWTSEQCAG